MRISVFICSLFLVTGWPAQLSAQEVHTRGDSVQERARVRLRYTEAGQERRIAGRLVSLTTDTVEVRDNANMAHWTLPMERVSDLEISSRRSVKASRILLYGLIGLAVGAGVGALAGSSEGELGSWYGAIMLGPAGFVVGSIGGALPRDRWERVAPRSLANARDDNR
jgi:hypothetical protein